MSKIRLSLEFVVILLAAAIAINSQFSALVNEYVLNGDVFQALYWMRQFRDSDLFTNDLLTEYAKNFHSPWGVFLLYRALSVFVDPIVVSKILPIILLPLSSVYLFWLVRHVSSAFAGFVAALLFMITPIFLPTMVGGHGRAFAYPFLIMFVYYLISRDYVKSSLVLVAQCLFYPMVFLVSALTYLFSFINVQGGRISFDRQSPKLACFVLAGVISFAVLTEKHLFSNNATIGTVVTRSDMINRPEFTASGRAELLAVPSLPNAIVGWSAGSVLSIVAKYPVSVRQINKQFLNIRTVPVIIGVLVLAALVFLIVEIVRGTLTLPHELLYLLLSSIILYKVADMFLFKLYLPIRYLQYTVPVITVMLISIFSAHIITTLAPAKFRTAVKILILVFVGLHFNINKDIGFRDYGNYYYHQNGLSNGNLPITKHLYIHLNGLPKNALIGAHPYLADAIPTFAQRKVFINSELSHPFFDKYWAIIKVRTVDFFEAYYGADPMALYQFCNKHGIDYLVIDKRHFEETYLREGKMYFEPFNTHIRNFIGNRRDFAVLKVAEERDKLFTDDNVFVISSELLKNKITSSHSRPVRPFDS